MRTTDEYRQLGMHRRIARRDFLNGVAVGVAGAYASIHASSPAARHQVAPPRAAYPPDLAGLRGQYPAAVEHFAPIRRGAFRTYPGIDVSTGERYDLAIVGAGISGLAAAYFWQRAL